MVLGQRRHAEIEEVEIVLGAGALGQRPTLHQTEALNRRPWGGKRPLILDRDQNFEGLSPISIQAAPNCGWKTGVLGAG